MTAAVGLDVAGQIKTGDKVLVTAAAGGTGHIGVQWAKLKGCHVIGTTSSDEKETFLKSIGCDHVINYKKKDMFQSLTEHYPEGVDVIWETIGGQTFVKLLKDHLAIKGRIVIVGGISGYQDDIGIPELTFGGLPAHILMKSQTIVGFMLPNHKEQQPKYMSQLISAINLEQINIKMDNGETCNEETSKGNSFNGLESTVNALNHIHSRQNAGKVYVSLM